MGKILIICGLNALHPIEGHDPTVDTDEYTVLNLQIETDTRLAAYQQIPVGTRVVARDQALYSVYKYAIGVDNDQPGPATGTWDNSYSGTAWITNDIVTTSPHNMVLVARIDNANVNQSDIEYLTNNLILI